MVSLEKFSEIVVAIYEAGLQPDLWDAALSGIGDAIGAVAGGVAVTEPGQKAHLVTAVGSDPSSLRTYGQHYGKLDPFVPQALMQPTSRVIAREMIIHPEMMRRSEFYNDWLLPQKVDDAIIATIGGPESGAFVFGASVGVSFDKHAVRMLQLLSPHLRMALRIRRWLDRLSHHRNGLLDAIVRSNQAVFFLDVAGRIVTTNVRAERYLRDADVFTARGNKLSLVGPRYAHQFFNLVTRAVGVAEHPVAADTMSVVRAVSRQSISIVVLPLSPEAIVSLPKARVAVIATAAPAAIIQDLQQLFSLTPAEARVAELISTGKGVNEAARRLNVAPSTVRTHLLRVFAKTGTKRQAELALLIARIKQT